MQGKKIGESLGKITSRRLPANQGGGPKMETLFAVWAPL
jgi:hypothetical protein